MDDLSAGAAPAAWQFKAPSYASDAELLPLLDASETPHAGPHHHTPAAPSPLRINVRAYGMVLVAVSLVFVWLWMAAGTDAGTWWRPVWYAAGLLQAVVAGMLLCAAGGEKRRQWAPPLGTTLLPLAAPLISAVLLEIYLAEPDAGEAQKHWALWAGRAVSVLALVSAGAAAGLYWRRHSKAR